MENYAPKELPVKVEVFPYRRVNNKYEFLLLKRVPSDGGFWQPVTGTLELNESIPECALREMSEEAGITPAKVIFTSELYRFAWQKKDYTVVELVYGAEIPKTDEIVISEEHDEFKWCDQEEAISLLKMEDNVIGFKRLLEFLEV